MVTAVGEGVEGGEEEEMVIAGEASAAMKKIGKLWYHARNQYDECSVLNIASMINYKGTEYIDFRVGT